MRCSYSARRGTRLAAWARLACLGAVLLAAAPPARPSGADHLRAGRDQFFNEEYALAAESFRRFRDAQPEEPQAYISLAKALLYEELSRLRVVGTGAFRGDEEYNAPPKPKPDEAANAGIVAVLRQGQALCRRMLAASADDWRAMDGLAKLHALQANFEFLVTRTYFKALASAKRGRILSYRVAELRPDYVDGLLVAGLDEYVLGSLSWPVRTLIALSGYRGSKRKGAAIIMRVASEGTVNRDDARLLVAIMHRREKRPLDAAQAFEALASDFPRAYTYRLEAAAMHLEAGNRGRALAIFREVERMRSAGEQRYDRMPARLAAALARRIKELAEEIALLDA